MSCVTCPICSDGNVFRCVITFQLSAWNVNVATVMVEQNFRSYWLRLSPMWPVVTILDRIDDPGSGADLMGKLGWLEDTGQWLGLST